MWKRCLLLEQWFLILTVYHTGSFKKKNQKKPKHCSLESHPTDSQLILEQYLFELCGSTYMFFPPSTKYYSTT